MKAHLAKLSLALLSTVFLLGCQEQGPGPVGPDGPQFHGTACEKHHKKDDGCEGGGGGGGETEAATYTVTHTGDITTDPLTVTAIPHPGKPGSAIHMGKVVGNGDRIVLSDAFVSRVPGDGERCFPKTVGDKRAFGPFEAGLRARKGKKVTGVYVFRAFGTDGTTPVAYSLEPTVTVPSGAAFPPDRDQTTTVTWDGGLMHTEGEVTGTTACVGGGGKHSAQKIVEINGSVEIVGDPVT